MGLLLLRFGASISLTATGIGGFSQGPGERIAIASYLVAIAAGILLLAGLWTPVVGALAAASELWSAFLVYPGQRETQCIHILLTLMAASIAMLGPGAWSVDARLYGRKRFDVGSRGM